MSVWTDGTLGNSAQPLRRSTPSLRPSYLDQDQRSDGQLDAERAAERYPFECAVTAVRIRDKIAASKRKGLWARGNAPLGYEPNGLSAAYIQKYLPLS